MSTDSAAYLHSLFDELGLDAKEFPDDRNSQLTLIIAEIIRNAMYSLFILERINEDKLPSTTSLNHFVRRKSEALLSGIFAPDEINDEINSLLKHNDRKEKWSINFYDLGQILYVSPGRIEYAPMRVIESEHLSEPILVCSWPTKVLRQMGLEVSIDGLSRTVSKSSISKLDIGSQSLHGYCEVPAVWKSALKKDADVYRFAEILLTLSIRMPFSKWKEEVQDFDIGGFEQEYGSLKYTTDGEHQYFDRIRFPPFKLPFEGLDNRWAIFKTTRKDSYHNNPHFWFFLTGEEGAKWDDGTVMKIPRELVIYVARLLAGRQKITILEEERKNYSRFSVGGAPPHAARRLLHSLGSRGKLEPRKPLTYEIRTKYRDPVIEILCSQFMYELEEGS